MTSREPEYNPWADVAVTSLHGHGRPERQPAVAGNRGGRGSQKSVRSLGTRGKLCGSVRRRDCGHGDRSCPWTTSSDRAGRISLRPSILRSRRLAIRRECQRPTTADSPRRTLMSRWIWQTKCRRSGELEWRVGRPKRLPVSSETCATCRRVGSGSRSIGLHSAAVAVTPFTLPLGGPDSRGPDPVSHVPLLLARPLQFVRWLGRDR